MDRRKGGSKDRRKRKWEDECLFVQNKWKEILYLFLPTKEAFMDRMWDPPPPSALTTEANWIGKQTNDCV